MQDAGRRARVKEVYRRTHGTWRESQAVHCATPKGVTPVVKSTLDKGHVTTHICLQLRGNRDAAGAGPMAGSAQRGTHGTLTCSSCTFAAVAA